MARGASRVIPASMLLGLAVLIAVSCTVAAAAAGNAPASGGSVHQAGGGANDDRGGIIASRFVATAAAAAAATGKTGTGRGCRRGYHPGACAGAGGDERRLIKCCGGLCTDVLASTSSCGACGKRCAFGRLCCAGRCVAVAHDAGNCGACGRACDHGLPCTYGMCGYAS